MLADDLSPSAIFAAALPWPVPAGEVDALGGLLERVLAEARAAWPDIRLARDVFLRHLAERIPAGVELARALADTHAGDLYLACACAAGDERAAVAFERHFMSHVTEYIARRDALPGFSDELKQILRERLLVAGNHPLPKIAGYSGRGPLGGWLRIATVRAAYDLRRAMSADHGHGELDAALEAPLRDPELEYLRRKYGDIVREAIRSALAALAPRESTILRLFFLQGLTMEALGALYRVDKRTARRWVSQARAQILDETRRRLAERLKAPQSQLDSLIRLVQSQVDLSVADLLDDGAPPGDPDP